jgi:hypothetical protein
MTPYSRMFSPPKNRGKSEPQWTDVSNWSSRFLHSVRSLNVTDIVFAFYISRQ